MGTLFGGFLFGALGDHIGRRRAVIAATLTFGILTLLLALSTQYGELLAVRALNGIALGGALPIISPDTQYTLATPQPPERQSWGPRPLFTGQLASITPLLWLGYVASSILAFFFATWGPT